ncbi:MAG TPA: hotdog fold domain-containing protein [Candidatus Lokiarchaeia archaeon]|nr:hotdog fold domain-containing protein [Candidatus Lokiarchaeia archaeon]
MRRPKYLQDSWPTGTCYGCGPANGDGMQIKSRWSDDGESVVAEYMADARYNSGTPGIMYGGTVAGLIDCHSIWTAIAFAYHAENREVGSEPPIMYVTGKLSVAYLKPTPLGETLYLKAWVEGSVGKKTTVQCELGPEGVTTATGVVTAVRINLML